MIRQEVATWYNESNAQGNGVMQARHHNTARSPCNAVPIARERNYDHIHL